ncbi:afadin [Sphaeramia orbicularis]|uniref:afadin n=1 Tax=Sphaeramia orbicularis TaxID=375764 RepID=UPI00117E82A3|nr:afadin-like [Sphaeramia orbicularis]
MPEEEKREKLAKVIRQWNNNRLDLFEISRPDENLEFHGVMRFYFEDLTGGNVATKCLRVCSNSSTQEVLDTLSEKFRPDMKMLTTCYSLYEIQGRTERKLDLDEKPLVVQLNWSVDDREGRFVLKKDQESLEKNCHEKDKGSMIQNFKRTLSKKDKKQRKKNATGDGSTETPLKSSDICMSDQEMKDEKQLRPSAAGGVSGPGLPVGLTFTDNLEDAFLSAVINYTHSSTVHFRLSPAYILYAAGRFVLHCQKRRGSASPAQTHRVTLITRKMVALTGKVIQRQRDITGALTFWMANSSELLNFLKHDKDLSPLTQQSQVDLAHVVHKSYSYLTQCLQKELTKHLPIFLIDPDQHGALPAGIEMVLDTLMNTMSVVRRCRVNAALTIQLFSQLFHFISAWLFNRLMRPDTDTPGLCSHYWGAAIRQRLTAIEAWAERQGLELAADCHLGHIIQATALLTMNKYSMQNVKDIQKTCFKLNSLQLQTLLTNYLYAANEPHIPPDLMDAVVTVAAASADHLIGSEGRDIHLEESLDLHLPFLLPDGGYSCDTVRGIPPGFREFLEPLCRKGLCSLISEPNSNGDWTIHFTDPTPSTETTYLTEHKEPEIVTITLNKPVNSGMGVSIVAAKGAGQNDLGIYIKSIVKAGPADRNGRLSAGDQLLCVDGQSLIGLSQERAAAVLMRTGPVVTLKVAKFGASFHGLGALLNELPPADTTHSVTKPNSTGGTVSKAVDPGSSDQLQYNSKRKKGPIMERNRQLHQSNPNVTTYFWPQDGNELFDPVVRANITAVSTINLCSDTFHREYLTLPAQKFQDKSRSESCQQQQAFKVSLKPLDNQSINKRTYMRQALSQENLCMESGRPLLDKRQDTWQLQHTKQTISHFSSFPIRQSISTHDILSDSDSPTRTQQGSRTSSTKLWKSPFTQQPTPTPSVQPIRIDIPLTRAVTTQSNPSLTTFQQSSTALKMSLASNLHGHTAQNQAAHIYARPVSAPKMVPHIPSQPLRAHGGPTAKEQLSITPTKHVSFQVPPTEQKTSPVRVQELQEVSDPGRREDLEQLEKQRRLEDVEVLGQEVQQLQAKTKRTAEENERLQRLSLEWKFQKRLEEIQQRGEEDEEEVDEDLDMMMTIQELDTRAQNKRSSGVNNDSKNLQNQTQSHFTQRGDQADPDQRPSGLSPDVHNTTAKQDQRQKLQRTSAPEKLTFKERQRLFALTSSA